MILEKVFIIQPKVPSFITFNIPCPFGELLKPLYLTLLLLQTIVFKTKKVMIHLVIVVVVVVVAVVHVTGNGNAGGLHLPVQPTPEAACTSQQLTNIYILRHKEEQKLPWVKGQWCFQAWNRATLHSASPQNSKVFQSPGHIPLHICLIQRFRLNLN